MTTMTAAPATRVRKSSSTGPHVITGCVLRFGRRYQTGATYLGLATIELPKRLFLFRPSDERNLQPLGKVTDVCEERYAMMITAELRHDPDVLAGFAEGYVCGLEPVLANVKTGSIVSKRGEYTVRSAQPMKIAAHALIDDDDPV